MTDENIHSIQITGNFDNWSRSLPTIKSTKEYLQQIKLDHKEDVVFKFIINDDQWIVNDQFKVTHDEHGNSNNIIYADELVEESEEVPAEKEKDIPIAHKKELTPVEDEEQKEEEEQSPIEEETPVVNKEIADVEKDVLKSEEKELKEEIPEAEEEPIADEEPVVPKEEPIVDEEPVEKPIEESKVPSDEDIFVPPVSTKEEKEAETKSAKEDYEERGFRIGVPKDKFVEEFQQEQEVQADNFVGENSKGVSDDYMPEPQIEEEEPPEELVAEDIPKDTVVVNEEHESFVEPDVSLKSPSKSITTEDDIISDIDTTKTNEDLPNPSSQQQQQPLTQVLTSSSSFAAISSPPLSSDYEHLEKDGQREFEEDDDETDYNTASNSGISTEKKENPLVAAYQENKPVKPVLLTHVSETTIDASGGGTSNGGDTTPKLPGHYPVSPEHKSSSTTSLSSNNNVTQKESTYTGKRESLISRFKSLFR